MAPGERDAMVPAMADTLPQLILAAAEQHGSGIALRARAADTWVTATFADVATAAREIAAGLIDIGVQPGDRVAIIGDTRPEWTLADCGALCAGAVVVPVYQTSSPEECRYVLAHAGARVIVCEDAAQVAKLRSIRDELPALEHVLSVEPVPGIESLDELRARARTQADPRVAERVAAIQAGDVATIVYTSGTTGPPKGCELTHANCVATVRMYESRVALPPGSVIFMFLPLAHALARMVEFVALESGATLSFWGRDPKRLLDDLAVARPTHFPSVPRLFEKVRGRALATAEESGPVRRRLFHWALATGAAYREADGPGVWLRARHALADRLVLHRVRALFGGELRLGLTGAAPIGREVLEFFDACGLVILEGYGMTETCAAATLNTPGAARFGTVGRPLPGCDVTIADDGEVLLRGPMVFRGYRDDRAATAATFEGEWLKTGDLGSQDADGYLRITGRKKDLIITSSGKNITPSNLETALRESRWISEAVVFGDNRPYLVALLTLDRDEVDALAERAGADPELAMLIRHPGVLAEIQADVDAVNARVARIEQIKRFSILDHDFAQSDGEVTPTLKVKRAAVADRYAGLLDALYG
jgi:long-chain acyl-CoA synthetase